MKYRIPNEYLDRTLALDVAAELQCTAGFARSSKGRDETVVTVTGDRAGEWSAEYTRRYVNEKDHV